MKFHTLARDSLEVEITVIPLIDVLLFLVLFFVITTSFERQAGLKVNLPQASKETEADKRRPLEIAIDAEGRFYLDGRAVVNSRASTLQSALRAALEGRKDAAVLIRADEQSPFQAYVTAMDSAQLLGIKRLSIATQPRATSSGP